MTSITERPRQVEPLSDRRGKRSGMVLAVWILSLAVAGLAAWVIYDQVVESRTAVSSEIEALLDDYGAAWADFDGDAFRELVTNSYVFVDGAQTTGVDSQASLISNTLDAYDFSVEVIGEPMMYGDGPWYVAQVNHITASNNTDGSDGLSIFTIVEQDGTFLIRRHEWIGD